MILHCNAQALIPIPNVQSQPFPRSPFDKGRRALRNTQLAGSQTTKIQGWNFGPEVERTR